MQVKSIASIAALIGEHSTSNGEHSEIFSTSIKLPFAIKTLVLSILSGRLKKVLLYHSHTLVITKDRLSRHGAQLPVFVFNHLCIH